VTSKYRFDCISFRVWCLVCVDVCGYTVAPLIMPLRSKNTPHIWPDFRCNDWDSKIFFQLFPLYMYMYLLLYFHMHWYIELCTYMYV
jgi:hypothetical protein